MAFHQKNPKETSKTEWITPPPIYKPLGHFDLDPCSPRNPPFKIADRIYTEEDNGLIQPWSGRVWLNPPYTRRMYQWMELFYQNKSGIALIFARTDVGMWREMIWELSHSILFWYGRINFLNVDGTEAECGSDAPSVLISPSEKDTEYLVPLHNEKGKLILL